MRWTRRVTRALRSRSGSSKRGSRRFLPPSASAATSARPARSGFSCLRRDCPNWHEGLVGRRGRLFASPTREAKSLLKRVVEGLRRVIARAEARPRLQVRPEGRRCTSVLQDALEPRAPFRASTRSTLEPCPDPSSAGTFGTGWRKGAMVAACQLDRCAEESPSSLGQTAR